MPCSTAEVVREAELFAPQVVLADRHPSPGMLGLAVQFQLRIAVVTPRERQVTLYEVTQQVLGTMQDVIGLLEQSSAPEPVERPAVEVRPMRYARITHLYPMEGQAEKLQHLLDTYVTWLSQCPGFVMGMSLSPMKEENPIARITVWEGRGWADATALSEHALAARSQLMVLTRDQAIHEEEFAVGLLEALGRLEGRQSS